MTGPLKQLFTGVTTSPSREFVAARISDDTDRVVLPCVGRWAVPVAAVHAGVKPEAIEASDLSLFSSVLGYLHDPRHTLDELDIHVPPEYARFMEDTADECDRAAGYLLVLKMLSTPATNVYVSEFRRNLWQQARLFRDQIADGLRAEHQILAGVRYDIADVRLVVQDLIETGDEHTFAYVNLPGYKGGYGKLYGEAEAKMWSSRLILDEFDPAETLPLLESLTDSPASVFAYVHHGDDAAPDGWIKHAAIAGTKGRVDYVIANREHDARMVVPTRGDTAWKTWPLYDEQEITRDSVIEFVDVDRQTGLHYRDLLVHRLGQTKAETYGLMLIDGRVVTAFGLHRRELLLGKTPYVGEVFGISITSKRYNRLGKLFMLALTSGDAERWMMTVYPSLHISPPRGIQTASPAKHHEGKTDRNVMKLVRRIPLPGGGFQLLYRGDFRTDTWADVMAAWHDRYGHISRPDYEEPT